MDSEEMDEHARNIDIHLKQSNGGYTPAEVETARKHCKHCFECRSRLHEGGEVLVKVGVLPPRILEMDLKSIERDTGSSYSGESCHAE